MLFKVRSSKGFKLSECLAGFKSSPYLGVLKIRVRNYNKKKKIYLCLSGILYEYVYFDGFRLFRLMD